MFEAPGSNMATLQPQTPEDLEVFSNLRFSETCSTAESVRFLRGESGVGVELSMQKDSSTAKCRECRYAIVWT